MPQQTPLQSEFVQRIRASGTIFHDWLFEGRYISLELQKASDFAQKFGLGNILPVSEAKAWQAGEEWQKSDMVENAMETHQYTCYALYCLATGGTDPISL